MTTWALKNPLEGYTREQLEELKNRAIEFLCDKGEYNEISCANHLGLSMGQLGELKSRYSEEFQELYLRVKAQAENVVHQVVVGKLEAKSGQVSAAKWWLDRRAIEYRPSSKVDVSQERQPSNGKGAKMLDKYFSEGEKDEAGSVLRTKTLQ